MIASITTFLVASATIASGASIPVRRGEGISVTPHDQYSSSIGVLGCKIDTNHVAYWPSSVGCDDLCVKVSHGGRSVNLLKIDTSGGAFDISYDAWNYLGFGMSAKKEAHMGGGIDMEYETVSMDECKDLLDDGKLPLSAANSMNYVAACLAEPDSWVAKNYVLYNIADSICTIGHDEKCELDMAVSNQPSCPSGLGTPGDLKDETVVNIAYGTGKEVDA